MSEQRFKPSKYAGHVWDTKTDKDYYFTSEYIGCNELFKEIEKLEEEKEGWKHSCIRYINIDSILSMDCQIVQEAIWDLEKAINEKKDMQYHLNDLKKKFNKLQNHRIGLFGEDEDYDPEEDDNITQEDIVAYLRAYHEGDVSNL